MDPLTGQRLHSQPRWCVGCADERFLEPAAAFAKWPRTSQKSRRPLASLSASSGSSSSDHASAARTLSCSGWTRSSQTSSPTTFAPRRRLGELGQPLRVPQPHLDGSGFLETLDREVADRLEHREARVAPPQQVVVDERAERLERRLAHLLRGLQRAAADEDAEPGERHALCPGRGGRSSSGSSPRGSAAAPARRAGRTARRFGSRSSRSRISAGASSFDAGCGELDRERQTVEPPADARDLRRARRVELEAGIDGAGASGEQPQRVGLDERLERQVRRPASRTAAPDTPALLRAAAALGWWRRSRDEAPPRAGRPRTAPRRAAARSCPVRAAPAARAGGRRPARRASARPPGRRATSRSWTRAARDPTRGRGRRRSRRRGARARAGRRARGRDVSFPFRPAR